MVAGWTEQSELAPSSNTVIGIVATKFAQMAQNGIARTIRKAHTILDAEVIFALSTGKRGADITTIGSFAVEVMIEELLGTVRNARPAGGFPSFRQP